MKTQPVRDLSIVGDFVKYTLFLFVPLLIIGVIYGLIYECYIVCILFNPLIYSAGISLVIIVFLHDVNDILDLVGLAKEHQLSAHIKHARDLQEIAMLMSGKDYDSALTQVDRLLKKQPGFYHALNMKGEILLEGFQEYGKARKCFNKVLRDAKSDDEQYQLAEALKSSTYADEEE